MPFGWRRPQLLAVRVESLQDVDGVVDEQSQPGQAEEDPRGHEDTVPLGVDRLRVAVCEQQGNEAKVRVGGACPARCKEESCTGSERGS